MTRRKSAHSPGIQTVYELKKIIFAHAILTGNTFAFHNLFSSVKEFAKGGDDAEVNQPLMDHVAYLLPEQEVLESAEFKSTLERVDKHDFKGDFLPAVLLEETAGNAVTLEKFAYAEDAYRLLGIKKEMVALYAQRGEQFLREGKPSHGAMAFLVAATIDQPVGPNFQYIGPELHGECLRRPQACPTNLLPDELVDMAIRYLLWHESLAERLLGAAAPEQRKAVLGTLAKYRDQDIAELVRNLRQAVEAVSAIQNGKPDDYSPIGPLLLGRPTATNQAWQYLRELSFEHPIGAFCVCPRAISQKIILLPIIREGKSLIEFLLPPSMLTGT